jgi:hypothetical protein
MAQLPFAVNVSNKYGAPMGRASSPVTGKVHLMRVPFVDGDYDEGGAYWGCAASGGSDLWCAFNDDSGPHYFRAASRKQAMAELRATDNELEFYDVSESPTREIDSDYLDAMVAEYARAALWASTDDNGSPLDDEHSTDDIAPDTLAAMRRDCAAFVQANAALLGALEAGQAGHDFWLTRNGCGVGFGDRGLGAVGDALTKACKAYGEVHLYVGDDNQIHAE